MTTPRSYSHPKRSLLIGDPRSRHDRGGPDGGDIPKYLEDDDDLNNIAMGVGLLAAVALLRVVWGFSMIHLLTAMFAAMIVLSFVAPEAFIPVAYDAGSVTTGVLTAPVLLAIALGLSAVLGERSAVADGFGLLGLASVGPIILILLLGLILS